MTKLIRTSLKYRLLSLIMCVAVAVSAMPAFTLEIQASAEENTSAETQAVDSPETVSSVFAFPDEMKSANVTIGKDFFKDPSQSSETTSAEIDEIMANINSYGFNTVIINTSYEDKVYFETDAAAFKNGSPLEMLISAARQNSLFVYISFDINTAVKAKSITELESKINYLSNTAHKLSGKYLIDGIIIDGYYNTKSAESFSDYQKYGTGIGFENWLLDNNAYVFSLVSEAVHKAANSIAVGIRISNMWANSSSDPAGSDTEDDFEALIDGYSDTAEYIRNGIADFIVLYAYGSVTSTELNFSSVTEWWDALASEAEIPMFVEHANQRISTQDASFGPDQILKQLEACQKLESYRGSTFFSYEQLVANTGKSTTALLNYYEGKIDTTALYKELTMVLPTKLNFTTYEPYVKFQGTFDQNFDIYFNGELINLNEAGNFYFQEELDVGVNTFTFQNKANTVKYSITRKVKVLQNIEPAAGNTINVEERTRISVTVTAYKGSVVTATLNGKTITLTEQESQSDDIDSNSYYTKFTGFFTAPEGKIGEEQNLGKITINGSYADFVYESGEGSTVVVNAIDPQAEPTKLVKITTDNCMTYDYYTTDNIPVPVSPRLPAGTLDPYVKTVSYYVSDQGVDKTVDYYLTASGKRIKASDAELIDGYTIVDNPASVTNTYVSNTDTIMTINMKQQIPFTVSFSPCDFYSVSGVDYFLKTFNATTVYITFDYLSEFSGTPSFSSDSIFSSGEWGYTTVDGEDKIQLKLTLRKPGVFAGYTTSYDGNGNLTFTFNGYRSSVSGATIVIDPGHGYSRSPSSIDPGAVGEVVEQKINLALAKKVTAKLQALGANAIMLPTDTTYINVYERSSYARQYNPDMYISIHCNAFSTDTSVRGVETHYFTPFSRELAGFVTSRMAAYYENNVYGDGVNRNRGCFRNYFAVTLQYDFPSILIESGFVTNYQEAMALANETHQDGLANAIVQGISDYFALNS